MPRKPKPITSAIGFCPQFKDGHLSLSDLHYYQRDAINSLVESFPKAHRLPWSVLKKNGWHIVKVKIEIL